MSSQDYKGRDRRKAPNSPEPISYSDVDSQMGEFVRRVELNERILQRLQQYELMLLDAANLPALFDVLLLATPRQFGLTAVGLTLHDPEGLLRELCPDDMHYDDVLKLEHDSFEMQRLYGATPTVEVIDYDDARLDKVMISGSTAQAAVLLPLVRGDMLIGSFHWMTTDANPFASEVELDFIRHLAAIITICLENCVNSERLSQLSLLDPLTRLSNQRAFGMELRKEIARAQRNRKSLTLLFIEVDDFKDIAQNYGHLAGDFTLKSASSHIAHMLRRTDLIARCGNARFALLLPACSESKGQEIAERTRSDTEFMEIDDGRGANLFASLSVGLTSWNPQNYPAVNMEQLATQIETTADQALQRSAAGGGNRVSVARLTTMLV